MHKFALLGASFMAMTTAVLADYPTCTPNNALKRKEWSSLTTAERISYTDAILCLMGKPSVYEPGVVPASTSSYSDFAASHANVSLSIHQSGTFLSWHREFLHLMEKTLHAECNYPSHLGLPYWDWPSYTDAPLEESALFDGSAISLGGDGLSLPSRPPHILGDVEASMLNDEFTEGSTLPLGSGGGCVVDGPFANTTVHLGPFGPQTILTGLPANWTEKNPQCFSRDLNDWALTTFNNASRVATLLASTDIEEFQAVLNPSHRGGHISVGGQLADFYVSPLEPAFWLHHGQIDRLWSLWQDEDEKRRLQYNGTSTFQNPVGETPEVDGDTRISFVPLGEDITLKEATNPMGGRYCYQYV